MYPSLSTRRRLLLALLILGGKSTYSAIRSFLPVGYSGPKFYAMLRRLEREHLVRRSLLADHFSLRLLPAGLELLERRFGPRIWQLKASRLSVAVAKPVSESSGGSGSETRIVRRQTSSVVDEERQTLYDTSLANATVKRFPNRASQTQPLDDSWSLIILNFPTDQAYSRSRLAGRLLELGCRPLRDGVYLSPYPILDAVAEWAEENNCLDRIFSLSFSLQPSAFSIYLSAWDLPAFSRRYLSLLDRLNISKGVSLPRKRDRAFARIKSDFLDLVVRDPLLPQALLPADYPLARVIGEITNLDKDVSSDIINIDNF